MSVLKKAAAAALLATGLNVGAEAAVQSFTFEGEALSFDATTTASFGLDDGWNPFSVTLQYDPAQSSSDATYSNVSTYADDPDAPFLYISTKVFSAVEMKFEIGGNTWDLPAPAVVLDTAYDANGPVISAVMVRSTGHFTFANGYDAVVLYVSNGTSWNPDPLQVFGANFDPVEANGIVSFNDLDEYGDGELVSYAGGLRFRNVTMTIGGVPEPATWLTLIMGFGLAGVAVRRRRVACAVQ